jgi:hypothetical protein
MTKRPWLSAAAAAALMISLPAFAQGQTLEIGNTYLIPSSQLVSAQHPSGPADAGASPGTRCRRIRRRYLCGRGSRSQYPCGTHS